MEICSTKDLIDLLKEIGEPQSGYSRFFRGHSDHEWKIEPSIYRLPKKVEGKPQGKAFIENEDNIIRDAIVNSPDDFSEKNSIFSILVKLQHYGYPTRLLDLTTNALVSLYFAVKSFHDDKDGELLIFDIPNEDVKYFDSDTVSVLSALSLRKEKFRIDGSKSFSKIRSMIFKVNNVIDKLLSHEDNDRLIEILAKITGNLVNGNTVSFNDTEIALAYEEINKIIEKYNFDNKLYNTAIFCALSSIESHRLDGDSIESKSLLLGDYFSFEYYSLLKDDLDKLSILTETVRVGYFQILTKRMSEEEFYLSIIIPTYR